MDSRLRKSGYTYLAPPCRNQISDTMARFGMWKQACQTPVGCSQHGRGSVSGGSSGWALGGSNFLPARNPIVVQVSG